MASYNELITPPDSLIPPPGGSQGLYVGTQGVLGTTVNRDNISVASNYPWSVDNPYLAALNTTQNRKNRASYLEAALNWETSRGNQLFTHELQLELMEIQRQWALEDRAHDEEYNSPVNQARLMRQAGLNPDLAGIEFNPTASAAAPSGNAQPAGDTPVSLPAPTTAAEIVQFVSSTLSSVASFASGLTSLIQLPAQITQVSEFLANSSARKRLLDDSVSMSQEALSQSQTQTRLSKLSVIRDVAKTLGTRTDDEGNLKSIDETSMSAVLASLGMSSDDDKALLREYMSSADFRDYANSSALSSRESIVQNSANSYDLLSEYADIAARYKVVESESQLFQTEVARRIAELQNTDEFAQSTVSAQRTSNEVTTAEGEARLNSGNIELAAQTEHQALKVRHQQLQDYALACRNFVQEQRQLIADIDGQIAALESSPWVPQRDMRLQALHAYRSFMNVTCSQTCGNLALALRDGYAGLTRAQTADLASSLRGFKYYDFLFDSGAADMSLLPSLNTLVGIATTASAVF